jgi:hypothetical protein
MYDAAQIKAGFIDLIGWRPEFPGSPPQEPVGLLASTSGLYYNDQHPLLTYPNLRAIAPDFSLYAATAWGIGTTYATGDLVSHSSKTWRALQGSTGQTPAAGVYWEEVHFFAEWLQEKTESGIIRAVEDWISSKFEQRTARTLLSSARLYPHQQAGRETDANEGRLAGIEIIPSSSDNMLIRVDQIGLTLSEAQTVTVKLFASNQAGPIETKALTYAEAYTEQWFTLDWDLPAGPAYYIAYSQAAISGASVNGAQWWETQEMQNKSRYFFASPFTADADGSALWNARQNRYSASSNYGMNLRTTVRCDYTRFLLSQGDVLKGLIAKSVAMSLLREMAYNANVRVNRNESNMSTTQILYEIDGDSQGRPGGLKMQYEAELKAARFDRENIDSQCIPCRKSGVKYRTV